MNSQRQNIILFLRLLFVLVVCSTVLTLLIKGTSNPARARRSQAQTDEKILNIERYPNEPFELVEVKIGSTSVKGNIKQKFRDKREQVGIDHVKFQEADDWSKKMKIRIRNISGRRIYGMSASLFFEHYNPRIAFEIPLKRLQHADMKKEPLQPGDEVELEVNDQSFADTMAKIMTYGFSPNELIVVLAVDSAFFSEDFGWKKGSFIHRNPHDPNRWDPVDKPAEPGASRLKKSAGLILIGLKNSPDPPQSLQTCQAYGGFFGSLCTEGVGCYRVEEIGNGYPGTRSDFACQANVRGIRNKRQKRTVTKTLLIDICWWTLAAAHHRRRRRRCRAYQTPGHISAIRLAAQGLLP
jgi:hypothetical protein